MRLGHRAANGDDGRDATRRKDFVVCLSVSDFFFFFLSLARWFRKARDVLESYRAEMLLCGCARCSACAQVQPGLVLGAVRQTGSASTGTRACRGSRLWCGEIAAAGRLLVLVGGRASEVRSLKVDGFHRRCIWYLAAGVSGQWAHQSRASGHSKRWTERGAALCMH